MNPTEAYPAVPNSAPTADSGPRPGADDSAVSRAVEEYLALAAEGHRPNRRQFLARYPELAPVLDECLDALDFLHSAAPQLSQAAAGSAVAAEELHPTAALGDFRIVRELGRGGMGVVYEAEQLSLGRRVALKVLPFAATMDPRQLQRFHNEARAAAALDHPHIVHVYAVGCERAVHFYAMQLIDGQTLAAMIAGLRQAGGKPVPPEAPPTPHIPRAPAAETAPRAAVSTERTPLDRAYFRRVAELGIQAAEALDHAHALGIVHRDVKPANLLVDGRGGLWVTDFGLAHIQSDARLTMTGDLVGTLRYMSPEQALAQRVGVDHRTDVYSLGVTLYELLTLEPACAGSDRQELLRQIAFEEPRPPRQLNKAIPAELQPIVLKAMEKNPQERYATAKELADDLRRFLEDRPIRARPAGTVRRLRKWGRRHRAVVWAAALVVGIAVLFAGGTAVVWANQRAAVEAAAGTALHQADTFQEQAKWPEALAAARHAEALVDAGPAGEALRSRVRRRRADLDMVVRVEEIRQASAVVKGAEYAAQDLTYNVAMRDQNYETAFREYGVDVTALAPADAGARIGETSVPLALAAALDDWALVCKETRRGGDLTWKKLLAAARAADPDVWRNRVRDALESNPVDQQALKNLASSERAVEQPPSTLVRIAAALRSSGAVAEAAALLRIAQRRYAGDFWINKKLAEFCGDHRYGQWEDEARFATAAWALRPDSPSATNDLGGALVDKGALDEAVVVYKQAIRLKPEWAELHDNLGIAYARKGSLDEAVAAYKEATRLKPGFAIAWRNLGGTLARNGSLDEAVAACQEAIRLMPDLVGAHFNLGNALQALGRTDEAVAAYREAIRLEADFALAHCNLGNVLYEKGQFPEALKHLRRGHELGSKNARWPYPSARWVKECERLVELEPKLPAILGGQEQPADAAERVVYADLCQKKHLYAAAARLYREALTSRPDLVASPTNGLRYNAACAAALAGCGVGEDAAQLTDAERAGLRKQGLGWLRADFDAWRGLLDKEPDKARPRVAREMQHWLRDPDFNGVRGPDALDKLPEAERQSWQQLWADVADTLGKSQGKSAPKN